MSTEPWRELYGPYIQRNFIDEEVAAFLWNEMFFRSLDVLGQMPVDDKKELQEQLKGCPHIEKLGMQLSLTRLRDDVAKTTYADAGEEHKKSDVPVSKTTDDDKKKDDADEIFHLGVKCDNCQSKRPIRGIRYKCMQCDKFDLCEECEKSKAHTNHTMFLRIINSNDDSWAEQLEEWKAMKEEKINAASAKSKEAKEKQLAADNEAKRNSLIAEINKLAGIPTNVLQEMKTSEIAKIPVLDASTGTTYSYKWVTGGGQPPQVSWQQVGGGGGGGGQQPTQYRQVQQMSKPS